MASTNNYLASGTEGRGVRAEQGWGGRRVGCGNDAGTGTQGTLTFAPSEPGRVEGGRRAREEGRSGPACVKAAYTPGREPLPSLAAPADCHCPVSPTSVSTPSTTHPWARRPQGAPEPWHRAVFVRQRRVGQGPPPPPPSHPDSGRSPRY